MGQSTATAGAARMRAVTAASSSAHTSFDFDDIEQRVSRGPGSGGGWEGASKGTVIRSGGGRGGFVMRDCFFFPTFFSAMHQRLGGGGRWGPAQGSSGLAVHRLDQTEPGEHQRSLHSRRSLAERSR